MHRLPQKLEKYKIDDWTDFQELTKLVTVVLQQVIARYLILVAKLSADMADTHNRARDSLLCKYFRSDLLFVQNLPTD